MNNKYEERLKEIVDLSFSSLYGKINGGLISVENEASLQLQLSFIIKTIGDLFIYQKEEIFSIELEKPVLLKKGKFLKSDSEKAKIDIFISIENIISEERRRCAIELKFFKKANAREPNNRYDVFKDLSNLEKYGDFADFGVLLVATDHDHYRSHEAYSVNTKEFDFRHGKSYSGGTKLTYRTDKPYGDPITLNGSYDFLWRKPAKGINFMQLEVNTQS